jgi:hypothetical protein
MEEKNLMDPATGEIFDPEEQPQTVAPAPAPSVPMNLGNINQGTVAIEASRAVAEAQGKLYIAKAFPRDETKAYASVMEVCSRYGFASKAFYAFPRGGQTITGPNIRFAEELARCWGNVDYGIKELSRDAGKSELQAYAWDLETNTQSVQNFTNPHQREAGKKMVTLTSDRDIYENNANMAARRLRARILAILPAWLVDAAIAQCKKTVAQGDGKMILIDRVRVLVQMFSKFGVTQDQIEKRLKHKVESMSEDELTEFVGIYNSIKDKDSTPAQWFANEETASDLTKSVNEIK